MRKNLLDHPTCLPSNPYHRDKSFIARVTRLQAGVQVSVQTRPRRIDTGILPNHIEHIGHSSLPSLPGYAGHAPNISPLLSIFLCRNGSWIHQSHINSYDLHLLYKSAVAVFSTACMFDSIREPRGQFVLSIQVVCLCTSFVGSDMSVFIIRSLFPI